MKKLLHISDPHVGHNSKNWTSKARFQNLADWMIETYHDGDGYVLVITGDLINSAKKLDANGIPTYYRKVKPVIEKLRGHFHKVLIVPGNHDYLTLDAEGKKFPSKKLHTIFQDDFLEGKEGPLWVDSSISGLTFIGINTMQEELDKVDAYAANGKIGIDQLKALKGALDEAAERNDKVILYMHHHPLNPGTSNLQLKDADDFRDCIKDYEVQALLFGHNHLITLDFSYDRWAGSPILGIPFVFDAGSATLKNKWATARGYCIEIDLEAGKYRGFRIKYDKEKPLLSDGEWHKP